MFNGSHFLSLQNRTGITMYKKWIFLQVNSLGDANGGIDEMITLFIGFTSIVTKIIYFNRVIYFITFDDFYGNSWMNTYLIVIVFFFFRFYVLTGFTRLSLVHSKRLIYRKSKVTDIAMCQYLSRIFAWMCDNANVSTSGTTMWNTIWISSTLRCEGIVLIECGSFKMK